MTLSPTDHLAQELYLALESLLKGGALEVLDDEGTFIVKAPIDLITQGHAPSRFLHVQSAALDVRLLGKPFRYIVGRGPDGGEVFRGEEADDVSGPPRLKEAIVSQIWIDA